MIFQWNFLKSKNQHNIDICLKQNGPELLPRKEMLDLLTHVIGTNAGRVQQMAAQALLETSMAASGMEGRAAAQQDEIDVLLVGLQSPASIVREASLQV